MMFLFHDMPLLYVDLVFCNATAILYKCLRELVVAEHMLNFHMIMCDSSNVV